MKTLLDLCHEYGIPVYQDGEYWRGPCLWSFSEPQSLSIHLATDSWEDWIMGHTGGILEFVMMVEARLEFLGRSRFSAEDWREKEDAAEDPAF